MLLEIRQKERGSGKELILSCDFCNKILIRKYKRSEEVRKHHFCDKECSGNASKAGNILAIERVKTLKKIYNVSSDIEITNISQIPAIKKQKKQTCIKRHGVSCSFLVKDKNGIEKRIKTSLRRWGAEHPMKSKMGKKIWAEAIIERNDGLGFASKNTYKAFTETMLKTYGVTHPMHSKEIRAKFDWQEWREKIHNTMKENKTFNTSKPEDECYEQLCVLFGEESIERNAKVNNWSIDFYISNVFKQNVYLQLDGIYWHGLNKPLLEIKKAADNGSSQAAGIYECYFKDKKQNRWFEKNKIKLVRITDKEFTLNNDILLSRLYAVQQDDVFISTYNKNNGSEGEK